MKKTMRNDLYITIFTLPLYLSASIKYGLRIPLLLLCSVALGFVIELAAAKIQNKKLESFSISAWFLFPMVFPPAMPIWMILVSIFLALIIAVVFFGGHGYHIFSPVALGWIIGSLSFSRPFGLGWVFPFPEFIITNIFRSAIIPVIDHPLEFFSAGGPIPIYSILGGDFPQPLSNAVPAVTIVCGILLLLLRAIDFRTVIAFLITLTSLTFSFSSFPEVTPPESLLIGNVLFAAFFVLPDRRTVSRTYSGRWITGILAAVLAFIIRNFSGFQDGIFYAVLLTNIFSALIDEVVLTVKFRGSCQ